MGHYPFLLVLQLSDNQDVPSALKAAQNWLRNATNAELEKFPVNRSQVRDFRILDEEKLKEKSPDHKPFESPYHWAGFCAIGL